MKKCSEDNKCCHEYVCVTIPKKVAKKKKFRGDHCLKMVGELPTTTTKETTTQTESTTTGEEESTTTDPDAEPNSGDVSVVYQDTVLNLGLN